MSRISKLYQYDYVVNEKSMLGIMRSKYNTGYVLIKVDNDGVLDEEHIKDLIVKELYEKYGYRVFRDTIADMNLSMIQ